MKRRPNPLSTVVAVLVLLPVVQNCATKTRFDPLEVVAAEAQNQREYEQYQKDNKKLEEIKRQQMEQLIKANCYSGDLTKLDATVRRMRDQPPIHRYDAGAPLLATSETIRRDYGSGGGGGGGGGGGC